MAPSIMFNLHRLEMFCNAFAIFIKLVALNVFLLQNVEYTGLRNFLFALLVIVLFWFIYIYKQTHC